jgi:glyoxylase-like metal-dependent hydrolase (beta-lactamase superfamily II)
VIDRRTILGGTLAGAAIASLGVSGRAAAAAATGALVSRDLPGGLALVTGAGANIVVAQGATGAVVVDSGQAAQADALLALVSQRTGFTPAGGKKPLTLVNTCWRLDQTGGNDRFGAAGATILAQENTRLWMGTEIDVSWEDKVYPPRAEIARPKASFYKTESMALGDERIDCGHMLEAHTDGDLYVFFRKANVLAVGAAAAGRGWPVLDWETGGWMGGHIWGLETMLKLADDKTVIVPADGPLLTRADIDRQRAMYVAIMARMQTMMEAGQGAKAVIASRPAADYEAERGPSDAFVAQAFKSFWSNIRQFKAI